MPARQWSVGFEPLESRTLLSADPISLGAPGSDPGSDPSSDADAGPPGSALVVEAVPTVGQAFGISDSTKDFVEIDPLTGEVVQIIGRVRSADEMTFFNDVENIVFDPFTGQLFAINSGLTDGDDNSVSQLITIDPDTGIATIVGENMLVDVDALTFHPLTGELYAVDALALGPVGNPGTLYTIDKSDGSATFVANLIPPVPDPFTGADPIDPKIDGVAFAPDGGRLFGAYSSFGDISFLVEIDVSTGQMSLISPAGGANADDIEDITFGPDGLLYGTLGDTGLVDGALFEGVVVIDTATGLATPVGMYGEPPDDFPPGVEPRVPPSWDIEALVLIVQGGGGPTPGITIEKLVKPVRAAEGLTPGFWKNHSRYGPAPEAGWADTGFDPDDSFNDVFGVNDPDAPTLLEALNRGGGGRNALGRHAVAALLNAANGFINYAFSVEQVIAAVQQVYASGDFEPLKDQFDQQNNLGADLTDPAVDLGDSGLGLDADAPGTGPIVLLGEQVMFTYVVGNTGEIALADVTVTDDNATPGDPSDDLSADPVLGDAGLNVGDADGDGLLDPGESWLFTAMTGTAALGEFVNIGSATGTADGETQAAQDPAHWTVIERPAASGGTGDDGGNGGNGKGPKNGNASFNALAAAFDAYSNDDNGPGKKKGKGK